MVAPASSNQDSSLSRDQSTWCKRRIEVQEVVVEMALMEAGEP